MRHLSVFALTFACGALACASVQAQTPHRPVRHHHLHQVAVVTPAQEVIVKKRSFLDSGTVVPVGSESRYMSDSTIFNHSPPYSNTTWRRSDFGDEVLPGPFDLPGFRGGPSF
jgi:hypothetical protein